MPHLKVRGMKNEEIENADTTLNRISADATRCYVVGCEHENDILLHLTDKPQVGMADLCWNHANEAVRQHLDVVLNCPCAFCDRARKMVLGFDADKSAGKTELEAYADLDRDEAAPEVIKVTTESGSSYEVNLAEMKLRRDPVNDDPRRELRQDDKLIKIIKIDQLEVGKDAQFVLEGLGEKPYTLRRTTMVEKIEVLSNRPQVAEAVA